MPFEIREIENEFCVVKTDDDEVQGCHGTEDEAQAQLTALNIAESEEKQVDSDKSEISENGFPKSILEAARSIVRFFERKPAEEKEAIGNVEFEGNSGISVKEVNGKPWHVTWSTNAFLDRDGEFFSTKALENYVTESNKKDDKGAFDLWHLNPDNAGVDTDFAEKEFQGVVGRFLVEAGPYLDNEVGQKAMKFFKQYPDSHPDFAPEGWGASPRFEYLPEDKATGTYEWLNIVKTSTLPREAAANIFTRAGQKGSEGMATTITEEQRKLGNEIWGEDGFASMIEQGENATKELEKNVAFKKANEETEQLAEIEIPIDEIAKAVGEQVSADFKSFADGLTALSEKMETELTKINERVDKLSQNKMLKEATETPRLVFSLQQQRASESEKTVTTDEELLNKKAKEAQAPAGQMSPAQFFNTN